jgi:hypothetical protein
MCVPARQRWELEDSLLTGKLLAVDGSYDLRQPRMSHPWFDDITRFFADTDGLVRCTLHDQQRGLRPP